MPADFEKRYRAQVADLFDNKLTAICGVREMLAAVAVEKCVASSGPPDKIRQALKVAGIAQHFEDRLFSSYEVGSWKPDPGLFLHAAMAMGFAPDRCAVIEDSDVGVTAGLSAGMRVFQFMPRADETAVSGALPFSSMSQLPDLLAKFEAAVQSSAPPDVPAAASRHRESRR